jgi:hypothetical protein
MFFLMQVAGEIFAEKSILATEAQELQTRLFNISEETKGFMLTIDEVNWNCSVIHVFYFKTIKYRKQTISKSV